MGRNASNRRRTNNSLLEDLTKSVRGEVLRLSSSALRNNVATDDNIVRDINNFDISRDLSGILPKVECSDIRVLDNSSVEFLVVGGENDGGLTNTSLINEWYLQQQQNWKNPPHNDDETEEYEVDDDDDLIPKNYNWKRITRNDNNKINAQGITNATKQTMLDFYSSTGPTTIPIPTSKEWDSYAHSHVILRYFVLVILPSLVEPSSSSKPSSSLDSFFSPNAILRTIDGSYALGGKEKGIELANFYQSLSDLRTSTTISSRLSPILQRYRDRDEKQNTQREQEQQMDDNGFRIDIVQITNWVTPTCVIEWTALVGPVLIEGKDEFVLSNSSGKVETVKQLDLRINEIPMEAEWSRAMINAVQRAGDATAPGREFIDLVGRILGGRSDSTNNNSAMDVELPGTAIGNTFLPELSTESAASIYGAMRMMHIDASRMIQFHRADDRGVAGDVGINSLGKMAMRQLSLSSSSSSSSSNDGIWKVNPRPPVIEYISPSIRLRGLLDETLARSKTDYERLWSIMVSSIDAAFKSGFLTLENTASSRSTTLPKSTVNSCSAVVQLMAGDDGLDTNRSINTIRGTKIILRTTYTIRLRIVPGLPNMQDLSSKFSYFSPSSSPSMNTEKGLPFRLEIVSDYILNEEGMICSHRLLESKVNGRLTPGDIISRWLTGTGGNRGDFRYLIDLLQWVQQGI